MALAVIEKLDEVRAILRAETDIVLDAQDHLTFEVPGARFSPRHVSRGGSWDGKKRLLHSSGRFYAGLVPHLAAWLIEQGHEVEVDPEFDLHLAGTEDYLAVEEHAATLGLPVTPREYQVEGVATALARRCVLVSPTASGKSLIIYLMARMLLDSGHAERLLVVVPRKALVRQMASDFSEYGFVEPVHELLGGSSKDPGEARITVSTWQSIWELDEEWFSKYDAIVGDEAHTWKATCLTTLMEKCRTQKWKVGLTGSLEGAKCDLLQLEGLFGPAVKLISSSEATSKGFIAEAEVKAVVLRHETGDSLSVRKCEYPQEIDYITTHQARNDFLANLACAVGGNRLLLFVRIEHIQSFADELRKRGHEPFVVYGDINVDTREGIRQRIMRLDESITLATFGTFQEGINIPNLHCIVLAHPTKSAIRVIQSIGRGRRVHVSKDKLVVFDVVDDISSEKVTKRGRGLWENHTLDHFRERLQVYAREGIAYSVSRVDIGAASGEHGRANTDD